MGSGSQPSAETRPARTPSGEAFTAYVVAVAGLGGSITRKGEELARLGGLTLARWVVLDAAEEQPSTVAQIARRRGMARQSVQRVADLLAQEAWATYEDNPEHRRSKLLRPTDRGRDALRTISAAQKAWADQLGMQLGEDDLRAGSRFLERVRQAVLGHVP